MAAGEKRQTSGQVADTAQFTRAHLALANEFAPPASDTERRLVTLWRDVLDVEGLGVLDDFFELGGDSFVAVTLFTEIERVFGQAPPLSALLDCPTIRLLAARLEQLQGEGARRPVIAIRPQGTRPPLFVVHAVKGHVLFVRTLARHLDKNQPLYAIQARGIEAGETPHQRFDQMAEDYVAALRRVQPKGPYHLAGYCIGSLIAFEMAQQLRAAGEEVAIVMMIDPDYHPTIVPWLYWRNPNAPHIRAWRVAIRAGLLARRLTHRLLGREKSSVRPIVTGEELRRQAAIRAGIMAALKVYRPRPYDGRVVMVCAADRRPHLSNETHGWPTIAPRIEILELAQSHRDIFYDALPALGRELQSQLDRVQAERAGLA
jgi:thioesterase domain-containing protein/acyl carrier protein